jgi:hypothetical protein
MTCATHDAQRTRRSALPDPADLTEQHGLGFWKGLNERTSRRTYADDDDVGIPELSYTTLVTYSKQLSATVTGMRDAHVLNGPVVRHWRTELRTRQHAAGRFAQPAVPMYEPVAVDYVRFLRAHRDAAARDNDFHTALLVQQHLVMFLLDMLLGKRPVDITRLRMDRAFTTGARPNRRLHLEIRPAKGGALPTYCFVNEQEGYCLDLFEDIELYLAWGKRYDILQPQGPLFPRLDARGKATGIPTRLNRLGHSQRCKGGACNCRRTENPVVSTNVMNNLLRKLLKKAGIKTKYTFHGLRANMAMVAYRALQSTEKVNSLLGWKEDSAMLLRYVRASTCYQEMLRDRPIDQQVHDQYHAHIQKMNPVFGMIA